MVLEAGSIGQCYFSREAYSSEVRLIRTSSADKIIILDSIMVDRILSYCFIKHI